MTVRTYGKDWGKRLGRMDANDVPHLPKVATDLTCACGTFSFVRFETSSLDMSMGGGPVVLLDVNLLDARP